MTIALGDDSGSDIERLHKDLSRYCHEHHVYMNIDRFTEGTAFLKAMRHTAYDLVFLDIYMGDTTGISVAERIRKADPKCQVIFITVSTEHAVSAYRIHALDYLVKPYRYEDLEDAMERFEETAGRFARYIELKEGRYYTRVRISDIVYTDIPITISRSIPQAVSCGPICPSKPSFRCLRRTRIFSGAVGTVWSIWIISNRLVRSNFS